MDPRARPATGRWLVGLVATVLVLGALWFAVAHRGAERSTTAPERAEAATPAAQAPLQPSPPRASPTDELNTRTAVGESARQAAAVPATPDAPLTPVAELAELRGRFVLQDGSPAPGVELRMWGGGGNSARLLRHGSPSDWVHPEGVTDEDGRFSFRFDPPLAFQFSLNASQRGFASVGWRWDSLPPREITDIGEIVLVPSGTVRGRVVDAAGKPVAGEWSVTGESLHKTGEQGRMAARVNGRVDPDTREFVLEGLPPGRARLSANSRITGWISGPEVDVRAGAETRGDIVYAGPDTSRRITVTTFNRAFHVFGNPMPGTIVARGPSGEHVAMRVAGSSQKWSFDNLEPGLYDLEINDPHCEPWRQSGVQTGSERRAALVGNAAVKLSVHDAMGSTIEEYGLRLRFIHRGGTGFGPDEFELRAAGSPMPTDGIYRGLMPVLPLRPVEERLQSTQPPGFELQVVAPGFGRGSAEVLELAPGEVREVAITLQPESAVQGSLVGVAPEQAGGVSVVIADATHDVDWALAFIEGASSSDPRAGLRMESRTHDAGSFEFSGLSSGTFRVVARFHHEFHGDSGPFELAPGATATVEVPTPSHGAIVGHILAEPDTFAHAWVEARGQGVYVLGQLGWHWIFGEAPPRASVGSDGKFRVTPLHPGTCDLTLHQGRNPLSRDAGRWESSSGVGRPLGSVTVTGPIDTVATFDLTKQSRGTIRCEATVDGEPAAGLRVHARSTSRSAREHPLTAEATTGADGAAHLERLEPGSWELSLSSSDGLWSFTPPTPSQLDPGGELDVRLDVTLHAGRLQVLDADTSHPRAHTRLAWGGKLHTTSVTTGIDGWLELRLPAGTYTLKHESKFATVEWGPAGPSTDALDL